MRTIAVTSGKGGVGKTTLAANFAAALVREGQSVLVVDADLGLANLDIAFGVRPTHTLEHVLSGEVSLGEAISEGPGGVRFLAGGSGVEALAHLSDEEISRLLQQFESLAEATDTLIFDTGAGISEQVLRFLVAADETLLVVTPDPASVTDGYAIAKALLSRRQDAELSLLLNMTDSDAQGRALADKLCQVIWQFLGVKVRVLGCVTRDAAAAACVRKRRLFVLEASGSAAAQAVTRAARSFAEVDEAPVKTPFLGRFLAAFHRKAA